MAEQTIALDAAWYTEAANSLVGWVPPPASRPQIDAALAPTGTSRYLRSVHVFQNGEVYLRFSDDRQSDSFSAQDDLTDAFEASGNFTISSGDASVSHSTAGGDLSDPYEFTVGSDATAFFTTVFARTGSSEAGSVTLRDFVPAAPAFADDTGDAISGMVGTAIADITVPEATGAPAPTYAVEGTLPAGLQFDTGTRVLSGTPEAVGSGTITIRATNSQGTADWTVDYTFMAGVSAPSFADDTGDPISAETGTAIRPSPSRARTGCRTRPIRRSGPRHPA